MRRRTLWAAVMAAVLCLAGVLAGCKPEEQEKGMFDGIDMHPKSWTDFWRCIFYGKKRK